MKFDVVVGNPPYQENDNGSRSNGSSNASASPLYHLFFNLANNITTGSFSLIFPARWLTGAGKGLQSFTNAMMKDRHIRSLVLYKDGKTVFPNTDIKGGVVYLVYDKEYDGAAEITVYHSGGVIDTFMSQIDSVGIGVFIPFSLLQEIYTKVVNLHELSNNSMQSITSARNPYGLTTDFFANPGKYGYPDVFEERQFDSDITIHGLYNGKRQCRFAPYDYPLIKGQDTINKWKLFAPYAYGCGALGEVGSSPILGSPILGLPMEIATETFLTIGSFDSEYEAVSCLKYYKTKFFRVLVGILKVTQHSTTTFRCTPIQDFTPDSDIDWTKSIAEIDQQLYAKYDLSDDEIAFIEEKVKPMA